MRKIRVLLTFVILLLVSFLTPHVNDYVGGGLVTPGFSLTVDWFKGRDPLERLDSLNRVLYHIKTSYIDSSRVNPKEMFKKSLDHLSLSVPEVRTIYPSPDRAVLLVDKARLELSTDLPNLYALHASASDVLKFVRANKTSDISDADLEASVISGTLATLDPHSVYMEKELYNETKVTTTGKFGGLGIVIGMRDTKLTVIAPLDDTPASRAGLKPGDQIVKIGDESTVNMMLTEAVERMRGPRGVPVTISVMRTGWSVPRDFTLIRDIIKVVSIESDLLPEKIGYVRIKSFQANTSKDLNKHLRDLARASGGQLKGLVLDLRNDPGGLLDQAVAVSDQFLKDGTIVTTVRFNNTIREEERATEPSTEPNYPIVILVNTGTASASEIVSGALKRRDRALVLGQQTFGKGSIQSIFELPEDSALKLTIGQYLTPGDVSIQTVGISPDVRVSANVVAKDRVDVHRSQDKHGEIDLQRHLENPGSAPQTSEPAMEVSYLEQRTEQQAAEQESSPASANGNMDQRIKERLNDFEVRFAADILKNATASTRQSLMETAKQRAKSFELEEERKLVEALAKEGIDWTRGPSSSTQKCGEPKASIAIADRASLRLIAGEKTRVHLTLVNPGPCTLYRSWAHSKSKNYLFEDREFLFGKLAPGQSVSRDISIEIPKSVPNSLTEVEFHFYEDAKVAPHALTAYLPIVAGAKPTFAYTFDLLDSRGPESAGNGNGLIERDESIGLKINVRNIGEGPAGEISVSLKNLAGPSIFLLRGRAPISGLKPGEEKSVFLRFDVKPTLSDGTFPMELAVVDTTYRVILIKKISFSVSAKARMVTPSKDLAVKQDRTPIYAIPYPSSPVVAYASAGSVLSSSFDFEHFMRIDLPERRRGWILKDSLAPMMKRGQAATRSEIRWLENSPPKINTTSDRLAFEKVRERFARVSGSIVASEAAKDVYIYVNDKKVFYQSSPSMQSAHPESFAFDTSIPLEPGLNRVTLVARNQDDLASRLAFIILRESDEKAPKKSAAEGESEASDAFGDPFLP